MVERRGLYRILVDKLEVRRSLGRLRRRREDSIKMDLTEVRWGMGWIEMAQDMETWLVHVNVVMNLRVP
jgi:hypothetical protein